MLHWLYSALSVVVDTSEATGVLNIFNKKKLKITFLLSKIRRKTDYGKNLLSKISRHCPLKELVVQSFHLFPRRCFCGISLNLVRKAVFRVNPRVK
jgi:hypothetical protein